jgi:hypothetical protein
VYLLSISPFDRPVTVTASMVARLMTGLGAYVLMIPIQWILAGQIRKCPD